MISFTRNKKPIESVSVSDNGASEIVKTPIEWSVEKELLLVEWADTAQCYRWLNSHSYRRYTGLHAWFTIPTIFLSTLTGTASFIQQREDIKYIQFIIGTISLFVGVLSTIQQFLKISELKENYRISAIMWDKYSRNIRIELTKSPSERMNAGSFMKTTRTEFDHLMETTPPISKYTIDQFKHHFKGKEGSERRKSYDALRRPDILDKITTADNNRNQWFKNQSTFDEELNKPPIIHGTILGRKGVRSFSESKNNDFFTSDILESLRNVNNLMSPTQMEEGR